MRELSLKLLERSGLKAPARRIHMCLRAPRVRRLGIEVLDVLPHDPEVLTQGLCMHGARLFESVGGIGLSSLRELDPRTGALLQQRTVAAHWAEGIAVIGTTLVQLTYTSGIALAYALENLHPQGEYARYSGEGWGLAAADGELLLSDGTSDVRLLGPDFHPRGSRTVMLGRSPLHGINDITVCGAHAFANVHFDSHVYRFARATGRVDAIADGAPLARLAGVDASRPLNGITATAIEDEFYLTGKWWPSLFRVRID